MISREAQVENDQKNCQEFLEKLARLVNEYRAQLPGGMLVGALETVKFRTMWEANMVAEKELKKGNL